MSPRLCRAAMRATSSTASSSGASRCVASGCAAPPAAHLQQQHRPWQLVDDVQFENAHGFAVNIREGTPSTQLVVRGCKFRSCTQVLVNRCGWTTFEPSWISASWDTSAAAAVVNYDHPFVQDILGVRPRRLPPGTRVARAEPDAVMDAVDAEPDAVMDAVDREPHRRRRRRFPARAQLPLLRRDGRLPPRRDELRGVRACATWSSRPASRRPARSAARRPRAASRCRPARAPRAARRPCSKGAHSAGRTGTCTAPRSYVAEVPDQLIIRDPWMEAEVGSASNVLVRVDPPTDLDGPYGTSTARCRSLAQTSTWRKTTGGCGRRRPTCPSSCAP